MATLIVRHRVADFGAWKQVFDSMTDLRAQHGWQSHLVLRDAEDPNRVTIVSRVASLERARAYGASQALKDGMQEAGVLGPPEIILAEDASELGY